METWPCVVGLLMVAGSLPCARGQTNLLTNPSFEDDLGNVWLKNGFNMVRTTEDAVHGTYSLKCTERTTNLHGPIQKGVTLHRGRRYVFEGYVKFLSKSARPWEYIKAVVTMTLSGLDAPYSYKIMYRSFCTMEEGWIHIKGDIDAPQKDVYDTKFSIKGPADGVSFLLDNLTLYEVPEDKEWRAKADANIEQHRKSDVQLNVSPSTDVQASDVDIEVSLRSHLFAFGSMLRDEYVRPTPTHPLIDLAYYMFNWAAIQSYKWKFNKGDDEDKNPDFSNAIEATDILTANGLKVRGHSLFWNVEKNVPDWVKNDVPDDQLLDRLINHTDYMVNLARGKLAHWDVMNEHIAGHYFEERLNNTHVTKAIHARARELQDSALLYMNEFQCVTSGAQTEQYYDLAMEYINQGVPVDGLGIQGHTKDYVKPDPTSMWRRISRLAETGLEIFMTEFDIAWENVLERADWFEDAIRAFFGHPKLSGVILWDFWNETMRAPHHELVSGQNLEIIEPGQRWACLVKKEWTTKKTFNLAAGQTFSFRGFQGNYDVTVRKSGTVVQRESFSVGKTNAVWNLQVTDSNDALTLPEEVDYVPQCISHRAEQTIGTENITSGEDQLTCITRASTKSGLKENDAVSVTCEVGEVMTGCSSFHLSKTWARNGEKMGVDASGRATCTAFNGRGSLDAVKAFARCCKVRDLSCQYRSAGPSFPFDGAMAEARCSAGQLALGCSSYSAFPDMDGVRPKDDLSTCIAQSGPPAFSDPSEKSGSTVFSACCSSPVALDCRVEVSELSKLETGKSKWVSCPVGYTMTGCNAFAESGKAAGSKISEKADGTIKCKAFLGATLPEGSAGVRAYATCCRPQP